MTQASEIGPREERLRRLWEDRPWIIRAVLAVVVLILIRAWWNPSPDATSYLSMASSFISDEVMTNLGSRQLYYPPGYAVLISPLFLFSGHPFLVLSIVQAALTALVLFVIYRWSRPMLGPTFALGVTALVGCNAAFVHYSSMTLSEASFTLWILLASLVLARALFTSSVLASVAWTVLGAALVIAASTTRQVGIMVVAGCFCAGAFAALRKQGSWVRTFVVPLAAGLPALLVVLWLMRYDKEMARVAGSDSGTYVERLHLESMTWLDIVKQFVEVARVRMTQIGRLLVPGMHGTHTRAGDWLDINIPIYLAATVVAVWSWWRLVRPWGKRLGRGFCDVMLWTVPFYIGLYLVFPWIAGLRYFTPILPIFWIGICAMLAKWQRFRYTVLTVLVAAHLLVAMGYLIRDDIKQKRAYREYWPACVELTSGIVGERGVGVRGVKEDTCLFLTEHLIDRPVAGIELDELIPAGVSVVIQPAKLQAPGEGFEPAGEARTLRMFRREVNSPPGVVAPVEAAD